VTSANTARITQKSRFERLTGMPEWPSVDDVLAKLRALGSARQIADFLHQSGVKGRIGRAGGCPIAVYVAQQTGGEQQVVVTACFISVGKAMSSANVNGPIHDFVRGFDAGLYPERVEER
jgi:hypothetical protein